jgi:hypothetical protein
VGAIFLGEEGLEVFAFLGVIELDGVVRAGGEEEFAVVVKVEGCYAGFGFGEFELLRTLALWVARGECRLDLLWWV